MPELPAVFIPAQPLAAGQPRGQRGSVATVAVAAIYKFRGEEGGIQFYGFYDQNLGTFDICLFKVRNYNSTNLI